MLWCQTKSCIEVYVRFTEKHYRQIVASVVALMCCSVSGLRGGANRPGGGAAVTCSSDPTGPETLLQDEKRRKRRRRGAAEPEVVVMFAGGVATCRPTLPQPA